MYNSFQDKYKKKSLRLPNWDYRNPGFYFVTICVKDRICWFGNIENGEMKLSKYGRIVQLIWENIFKRFNYTKIDSYMIMPNHIHGVVNIIKKICIHDDSHAINRVAIRRDKQKGGGFAHEKNPMGTGSLSEIIRWFKGCCTYKVNKEMEYKNFQWQSKFYDHIVRNKKELEILRNYIKNNPKFWAKDKFYPILT